MEVVTTDYYTNFTMTRSAGLGDKVCVRVKNTPTRIELCSFDLEEPLPVLVWSERESEPVLSIPKDVEYRRIATEFADGQLESSNIDLRAFALQEMRYHLGLLP